MLTRQERYDVFFAGGGARVASKIEKVLRFRCQRIHQEEWPGKEREDGM